MTHRGMKESELSLAARYRIIREIKHLQRLTGLPLRGELRAMQDWELALELDKQSHAYAEDLILSENSDML